MSLANFHTNLKTTLAADSTLVAWAIDNFNKDLTQLDGVPDVQMVNPAEIPANIFEVGDAELGPMAIGGGQQDVEDYLLVGFLWEEHDPATALAQRKALADLFPPIIRKNRTLIGAGTGCWVTRRDSDKGLRHPFHLMVFRVAGQYESVN